MRKLLAVETMKFELCGLLRSNSIRRGAGNSSATAPFDPGKATPAAAAHFLTHKQYLRGWLRGPCALANSLGRKINYQTRYTDTAPHISRDSVKLSGRQFRVPVLNGEIELLTVPHAPLPLYYALAQLSGRFKGIPLTRHVLSLILRNFCDIQPRVHRRRIRPILISIKFPYRREWSRVSPFARSIRAK